jgi:general secretion pathway protein E
MEYPTADGMQRLLRLSFLPTIHGESVVIRYPRDEQSQSLSLDGLGMSASTFTAVTGLLTRQEGVILLTGPSSSGKTTTMYSMLGWLNSQHGDRMNILTIEDPVERDLGFASQVQVNPLQELTFDRALRSALRQDPNVLMVGEIRDVETARVTIQAGMSGHLVISTLHAGRASLVFSRLLSMGLEPYLVASAVSGAIAQRLARSICQSCDGTGCEACSHSGCAGRLALFECCRVTEALRELILTSAPPARVAEEATRSQTDALPAEALRLVEQGLISREEMEYIFAGDEKQ